MSDAGLPRLLLRSQVDLRDSPFWVRLLRVLRVSVCCLFVCLLWFCFFSWWWGEGGCFVCLVVVLFVLFRFVSFSFVLFRFLLFCFVLFCFVFFCFVSFCLFFVFNPTTEVVHYSE